MRILITGSSGFIGSRLVVQSQQRGWQTVTQCRADSEGAAQADVIGDVTAQTDWRPALQNVDCIVHCAARVHHMAEHQHDEAVQRAYDEVNVQGTLHLARQAADAGVKRFVFMSSVKVNGEYSAPERPFRRDDVSAPEDAYGRSKARAEQELKELATLTGLEVVIVRAPLVYGPGVKANFLRMMHWVNKGMPLPLGAIKQRRSLIFLDNLIDCLCVCCQHPQAAGQTFLVSDDHDVSVTELLSAIATGMGRHVWLIPVPEWVLYWGLVAMGEKKIGQRLCCSLQVDIGATEQRLHWTPPYSFAEGIQATLAWYQAGDDI